MVFYVSVVWQKCLVHSQIIKSLLNPNLRRGDGEFLPQYLFLWQIFSEKIFLSSNQLDFASKFITNTSKKFEVAGSKDGSTVRYIQNLRTTYLEPYRTSVPYFSSIFEGYRTNAPYAYHYKKAYCTSVPYFLAKIEAYRTVLTYCTVLPSLLLATRNFNWLWNHSPINHRSQFSNLASASTVFCLCSQNAGARCKKSGIFNSNSVPTRRTHTITKMAYRTNVPYP